MESNKILKFYLPSSNIDKVSNLIPLLGQAGLNAMLFKKSYQDLLKKLQITENILFSVHLAVLANNEFTIKIYDPTISFLIQISSVDGKITLEKIYKIAVFRNRRFKNLKREIFVILGTLSSMNIIIEKT